MTSRLRTTLVLLLIATAAAAQSDDPLALAREAAAAYEAGRFTEAAELYRRVTELLPAAASAKVRFAQALARDGKTAAALDALELAIASGSRFDASDAAWNSLQGHDRFRSIVSQMRARTAPVVRSEVAYLLAKDLIPENIAYDPRSGAFFVGSMYKAKIVRIAPDGTVSDFVPARRDGLLSVLGMKVDAARRELWAAAGNFGERPPMEVPDPESRDMGAIFRFHLDDGRLLGKYEAAGGQRIQFNDLVLTPEGDVYATAGGNGIWRLRRGAPGLELFIAPPRAFFNGIAITPDGRTLFGASHVDGAVKIDIATKAHQNVAVPSGVTLGGIDGLYFHEESLVGIQNGTDPQRVVRAWLDPKLERVTKFVVLEQSHPAWDIPLTGTIAGDDLYYVGRSQLRAFDGPKIWPPEKLQDAVILKLPLEPAGPAAADLEAARAELLEIHQDGIRAHIERDAESLARRGAPELVSAYGGKIRRSTPADTLKFFTEYFEGATYPQYEDLEPPVIHISDDGSMASILSRTKVRRVHGGKEEGFVYAGIMVYQKIGGRWLRVANASTFE